MNFGAGGRDFSEPTCCVSHSKARGGSSGNTTATDWAASAEVACAVAASRSLCDGMPASRKRSTLMNMISHQNFRLTCNGAILTPTLRADACSIAPRDGAAPEVPAWPAPFACPWMFLLRTKNPDHNGAVPPPFCHVGSPILLRLTSILSSEPTYARNQVSLMGSNALRGCPLHWPGKASLRKRKRRVAPLT